MARVLLTSVARPPDLLLGRWSYTDQAAYRLTRGQGIFTLRESASENALHLLAQNLDSTCTVLEFPTPAEMEAELVAHRYDVIGVTYKINQTEFLLETCAMVRRLQPAARLVVGGYGVLGMDKALEELPEAHRVIDPGGVCRGEGIAYLRGVLGERVGAPVDSLLPCTGSTLPWLKDEPVPTVGAVLSSLGCRFRCEFCSTSAFTGHRAVPVMDAAAIHRAMRRYWEEVPYLTQVNVFDEDLPAQAEKFRALGRLLREDEKFGLRRYGFFTFGSVHGLTRHEPDELLLAGLDTVWIGVVSRDSTLPKRSGGPVPELFAELHRRGIKTIGSFMLGLDEQDRDSMPGEIDFFVGLKPTFQQVALQTLGPGLEAWRRLGAQGRVRRPTPWAELHLYGDTYTALHFTYEELLAQTEAVYRRLNEVHGPSLLRLLEADLAGYRYCRASRDPRLRDARAAYFSRRCAGHFPLLPAMARFAPSGAVAATARACEAAWREAFGAPDRSLQAMADAVLRRAERVVAAGVREPPPRIQGCRRWEYQGRAPGRHTPTPTPAMAPQRGADP